MLNSTILNPDFVTSELNKLDVASLAEEIIIEQSLREEVGTELVNTISKVEPLVKEQVRAAIYVIYDYLLGESKSLDLPLILRNTVLSSDFVVSLVDELDVSSLAGEFVREQIIKRIPAEMGYMVEYLDESMDDVITELEPSMKEQLSTAADPIANYLLGESRSLNITISIEPAMESLRDNMWSAFLESPPSSLAGLPQAELEWRFNELYQEFAKHIPLTLEIDESLFGTEVSANTAQALDEA
jgi:hypothetical protein